MSDSLSPSSCDLVIDDDDLDSISVTKEDLSKAEANCGISTVGKVLARPALTVPPKSTFKFGAVAGTSFPPSSRPPDTGSRMSSSDPRTKFKPTGFLGLNTASTANINVDNNFNLKRTVQNSAGSSSFVQQNQQQPIQQPSMARAKFVFGASSPTAVQPTPPSTQFKFGGASFSPQHSPISLGDEGQDDDMKQYIQMKITQEAKMNAEKEKMERIEKLIQMKKQGQQQQLQRQHQQQQQLWHFDHQGQSGIFDKEIVAKKKELIEQEMELKKQTTMMLKMQQNMLMDKKNTEEERRRLEDQKQMLELQLQVKKLEMLITDKQGGQSGSQSQVNHGWSNNSRPVSDRLGSCMLGSKSLSVTDRLGRRSGDGDTEKGQRGGGVEDYEWRAARKRRFNDGRSDAFEKERNVGGVYSKKGKKSKYTNVKLPDDLVLTEFTDEGPVKKEDLREAAKFKRGLAKKEMVECEEDLDRYEFEGELDPELVLTEFGENGPVKAGTGDISSTSGK